MSQMTPRGILMATVTKSELPIGFSSETLKAAIQPLQEFIVSKRIERPQMDAHLHCALRLEHAIFALKWKLELMEYD